MKTTTYSNTIIGRMPHLTIDYKGYTIRAPIKLDFSAGLDKGTPVVRRGRLVFALPGGKDAEAANPWGSYLAERIALEQADKEQDNG